MIKAGLRRPFCECGDEATVWAISGEGYCEQCIKASYMTQLSRGHAVIVNGSGKPKWALIPVGRNAFGDIAAIMVVKISDPVTFSGQGAIDDAWDMMRGKPLGSSAPCRPPLTFHEFDESQGRDIPADDDEGDL